MHLAIELGSGVAGGVYLDEEGLAVVGLGLEGLVLGVLKAERLVVIAWSIHQWRPGEMRVHTNGETEADVVDRVRCLGNTA